jgi:hypothetical protein
LCQASGVDFELSALGELETLELSLVTIPSAFEINSIGRQIKV